MQPIYDFPVQLQDLFTSDRVLVPQVKAVRREDTKDVISVVSDQYGLIPHQDVFSEVEEFMQNFGEPEVKHIMAKNGAEIIGIYTFKEPDYLNEVALGDTVGLRVYVRNSYNASSSMVIQIGSLVLSCLNGMVSPKDKFVFKYRHSKNIKISMPEPEQLVDAYEEETEKWSMYSQQELGQDNAIKFLESKEVKLKFPSKMKEYMLEEKTDTVWDLMQNATNFVTHKSEKLSPVGQINRLETVSRTFDRYF